jgi:hypothetical protein
MKWQSQSMQHFHIIFKPTLSLAISSVSISFYPDFFTRSYDIGGVVSILALNGDLSFLNNLLPPAYGIPFLLFPHPMIAARAHYFGALSIS